MKVRFAFVKVRTLKDEIEVTAKRETNCSTEVWNDLVLWLSCGLGSTCSPINEPIQSDEAAQKERHVFRTVYELHP
jgi:hypothetical protein